MDFGYLPKSNIETGNLRTETQLQEAIRNLQVNSLFIETLTFKLSKFITFFFVLLFSNDFFFVHVSRDLAIFQ